MLIVSGFVTCSAFVYSIHLLLVVGACLNWSEISNQPTYWNICCRKSIEKNTVKKMNVCVFFLLALWSFCDTWTGKYIFIPHENLSPFLQVRWAVALLSLSSLVHSDQRRFLPVDCDDIHQHDNNTASGVYTIYPAGPAAPLKVHCDMDTSGGGWTVSAPYLEFQFWYFPRNEPARRVFEGKWPPTVLQIW